MSLQSDIVAVYVFEAVELEFNIWDTSWLEVFIFSDTELEALLV